METDDCYKSGKYYEIIEDLDHIDCEEVKRYGKIINLANLFEELREVAEKINLFVAEYHDDCLCEKIEEKMEEIKEAIKGKSRLETVYEELENEFIYEYF